MSDLIERLRGNVTGAMDDATLKRKAADEIERLNKRHDDFLQEFWKTNAENAKLQAVVDAAKEYVRYSYGGRLQSLKEALAALEDEYTIKIKGIPSKLEPPEDE